MIFEMNIINFVSTWQHKILTFIDEFKISPVKKDNYAWSVKGKPVWKLGYNSAFEISAIVVFNAEGRVYFLGTKQTINSEIFQFFLTKLISNEDRHLYNDERVWILSDNASIHETSEAKNLLKLSKASLIAITAYSPCLNPTEKTNKIYKEKDTGWEERRKTRLFYSH